MSVARLLTRTLFPERRRNADAALACRRGGMAPNHLRPVGRGEGWGEGARRLVSALLCIAMLASCATIPRLAAPEIRAAQARVIVLDFPRVRIGVDLAVFNPNTRAVALGTLDADLNVEGVVVAKTSLAQPVELRPLETTQLSLDASGHLGAALAGVARSLDSGNRGLRYEIVGVATLADGTQLPFRRAGMLAFR